MTKLEFFFDCTSPWTYLGFTGIQPMCEKYNVEIQWRPIIVGGVFNAVNPDLYEARAAMFSNERRMTYFMKDLTDWANYADIKIGWPANHPVNAIKSMRGCFYAESQGKLVPYAKAVFEAYWGRLEDVSSNEVLISIAESAGLDGEALVEATTLQENKDRLRANTDELVARGGFGSPTIYINDDDMYFGNDRLPLIDATLSTL